MKFVIPAKAGIHTIYPLDTGLRRYDDYSKNYLFVFIRVHSWF
ncbi:hypothetical protein [Micavibrio aeruginosavorus]|uniref:Uncharacterized protein n=1 Tax=Micavibrio aeruginosavorus (strain ARL-13) TaxID=856793 RepID=G2KQP3_MICAA|nr:hypothetical protein [Micavibrio aeruginosavorus]AEP09971.1 hypothetical protein MICA_1658 [Micavibrio aeruginosavorus ARL-13]